MSRAKMESTRSRHESYREGYHSGSYDKNPYPPDDYSRWEQVRRDAEAEAVAAGMSKKAWLERLRENGIVI